jgi:hypothetical protein
MLTIGAFLLGAVLTTQSNVQVTTTAVVHYATAYADEAWQNVDDTFRVQMGAGTTGAPSRSTSPARTSSVPTVSTRSRDVRPRCVHAEGTGANW